MFRGRSALAGTGSGSRPPVMSRRAAAPSMRAVLARSDASTEEVHSPTTRRATSGMAARARPEISDTICCFVPPSKRHPPRFRPPAAQLAVGGKRGVQFAEHVVANASARAVADALGQRRTERAVDGFARLPRHILIGRGFKCAISLGGKLGPPARLVARLASKAAGNGILHRRCRLLRSRRLRQRLRGRVLSLRFAHAQLPSQICQRLRISRRQRPRAFRKHRAKRRRIALIKPLGQPGARPGLAAEISGIHRRDVIGRFAPRRASAAAAGCVSSAAATPARPGIRRVRLTAGAGAPCAAFVEPGKAVRITALSELNKVSRAEKPRCAALSALEEVGLCRQVPQIRLAASLRRNLSGPAATAPIEIQNLLVRHSRGARGQAPPALLPCCIVSLLLLILRPLRLRPVAPPAALPAPALELLPRQCRSMSAACARTLANPAGFCARAICPASELAQRRHSSNSVA